MKKQICKNILTFSPSEWPIYQPHLEKGAFDLIFSSYNLDFKDSFIVGINECTNNMNKIEILFVCKEDSKPLILVQHLPLVAYLNKVLLVTLPERSSIEIGNLLANDYGIKRVLCFGLRKEKLQKFQDKIKSLFPRKLPDPSEYLSTPCFKQIPSTKKE